MYEDFDYTKSRVFKFIEDRLDDDRDCKIIITARNSETGVGKTTLALILAKVHDRNGWSHKKHFHDGHKYANYYLHSSLGDALVVDDFQFNADNRRSTSNINVQLSMYWTIMRTRNVVSIVTLPTTSILDKRFLELADIRINVVEKGVAYPYRIVVNDFTHSVRQWRWKDYVGDEITLYFGALKKDKDYRTTVRRKDKYVSKKLGEWDD